MIPDTIATVFVPALLCDAGLYTDVIANLGSSYPLTY